MLPQTVAPELLLTTPEPSAYMACFDFCFWLHALCVSNTEEVVSQTSGF